MPVLRIPTDTGLGDTLGNLGRSLSENFNPMNTIRAYDIQQQMWMRQQQLLQMQRENQARQAAIDQWSHIVPPDKLSQIALMIYQGAPYEQVARAAAQLSGNLVDDPNAMQQNIRYIEQLTGKPYDYTTLGPPVAGPNTAKQANDWKVSQAGATAGATKSAEIGAEQASRAPLSGMIDEDTPAAALHNQQIYQTVYGKPPENGLVDAGPITAAANRARMAVQEGMKAQATTQGQEQARQTLAKNYIDQDTPEANANNVVIYTAIHGTPPPAGLPVPVGDVTNAAYQKALATQEGNKAAATAKGTASQTPVDLGAGKVFPPPQGFGNGPTASAPAPPAPAQTSSPAPTPAPAPAQSVSVPNPAAPFAPATPVSRTTPAGTIIGSSPSETAVSGDVAKANQASLQQAMDEGYTAQQLQNKIGQLRDLETITQAGGPGGQIDAAVIKRLADAGIVIGDKASAYKAMDQILNTEIPDLRKASGIQRLAGPEITAVGKQIGSASLPPAVLNNIIANEQAAADIQVQRRTNAQNAYGVGPQPMSMTDYTNADNQLIGTLKQHTDELRKQYGAIGTEAQQPAPVAQPGPPALTGGSIWDAVSHLFGGGSQQPAPPAPAPDSAPPAQQFQFDPKTNSIVPVQ